MTHFHVTYYQSGIKVAVAGRYDDLREAQRIAVQEREYERQQAEVESRVPMRVIPIKCSEPEPCSVGVSA